MKPSDSVQVLSVPEPVSLSTATQQRLRLLDEGIQVSPLSQRYRKFLEDVRGLEGNVTYSVVRESWKEIGDALDTLIRGGSKWKLFLTDISIYRRTQKAHRGFHVSTLRDLEWCLSYYTKDRDYAQAEAEHERHHMEDMLGFFPLRAREPKLSVLFEVFFTSDRYCIPYTTGLLTVPGVSPLASVKFPWMIYFRWSTETIRAYFKYLRNVTNECSEGDALILKKTRNKH